MLRPPHCLWSPHLSVASDTPGDQTLASWLSMLWGRCHTRISPGQSVRSLSQSSLFCNRMSQQEKNTEIFRLLNCLEPYKSEFQSLQRDIEFAFQKLGKYKSVHVHTSIKLIFHQKKKRKTRKIFWCSKKPFQRVLIHPWKSNQVFIYRL